MKKETIDNEVAVSDAGKATLNEPESAQENEQPKSDTESANKPVKQRGRPKKPESEQKKSVSVYLTSYQAEALKDLAAYGKTEMSAIISELIEGFINENIEALQEYREFLKNAKPLKR